MSSRTMVRQGADGMWRAMWRGRWANAEWALEGPARAWLDICNRNEKWRA